jgi:molybdopterin-guanine dinucleotide biosynthesis protein A
MEKRAEYDPLPYGVILAGGEGRRMGGADKALLTLGGTPLIDHCLMRFAPQVAKVAISAAGDPARFAPYGLPVIADPDFGMDARKGPLAGIAAAMIWAHGAGASHIACVPVDGPNLPRDLVVRLGCASVPRLALSGGRQHPTYGIWPVSLSRRLAQFLLSGAPPRLRDFAAAAGAQWVEFDDAASFENINTPLDLARVEGMLP